MTTTTTAAEAVQEPQGSPQEPETPEATETPPEPPEEPESGNQEAARYRRKLRDTEAERDALRAERDAARRELLTGLLARQPLGLAPTAISEPGVVPAWDAVAGQDGRPDEAKVAEHVRNLQRSRPHLFATRPETSQGRTRGSEPVRPDPLVAAFSPRQE